ncbi:hypothetical protein, partial [Corynebacterium marambiense]|uniref:hypothetical protein n=1 Tax=Corynebacterium marambiense TaxID=2765364 RepID=UPI001E562E24
MGRMFVWRVCFSSSNDTRHYGGCFICFLFFWTIIFDIAWFLLWGRVVLLVVCFARFFKLFVLLKGFYGEFDPGSG